MRIVFFTDNFPYPLSEGGKVAQFYAIRAMQSKHELHLVVVKRNLNQEQNIQGLQAELSSLKLHIIDAVHPALKEGILVRIKRKFIWLLRKSIQESETSIELYNNKFYNDPIGLRSEKEMMQIVEVIQKIEPDIVQIDFTDSADIVLALPKNIPTVLIAHDLRYQSALQNATIAKRNSLFTDYMQAYIATKEFAFLTHFDAVISFSEADANRMREKELKKVFVSPFAIDTSNTEIQSIKQIEKIVFLGSDQHTPNLDALLWYAEEIEAAVKEATGFDTFVIGNWSEKSKEKFNAYPSIKFAGYVADLKAFVSQSIMVAPLRIGSGIRTKILEGFMLGTPVVSTMIGIEGIDAINGEHYLEANNRDSFIKQILLLQKNITQANEIAIAARTWVASNFSERALCEKRTQIFEEIIAQKNC